ncbi:VOC family protein [Gordonia aichiensis]
MAPTMFISLPVDDVGRSRRFFESIGFRTDEWFSDAGTVCLPINSGTMVVLLAAGRFAGYSATGCGRGRPAPRSREVVLAFSASSRGQVDDMADAALANGGTTLRAPDDRGFAYNRSFCDPDGHAWEIVWMNPGAIPETAR